MKKVILIFIALFILGCGESDTLKNYTNNYDTLEKVLKIPYTDKQLEEMKIILKAFKEKSDINIKVSKTSLKDMVLYSYDYNTGYMPINYSLDYKKFIEIFDGDIDILKRMVNTGHFDLFLNYMFIKNKDTNFKYKEQIKNNILNLAKINPNILYSFEKNTNLKLLDLYKEEEIFELVTPVAAFNIDFSQNFYDKHIKEFTLKALQLNFRQIDIFFNTETAKKSDLRNKVVKYIKKSYDKEVIDRSLYHSDIAKLLKNMEVEN